MCACNRVVPIQQLKIDADGLYYDTAINGSKPYTGKAYATFGRDRKADSNATSSIYEIENGIPKGKFIEYAAPGIVFQQGMIIPVTPSNELKKIFPFIKRISIQVIKSPDRKPPEFQISLISSNLDVDSVSFSEKKTYLIKYLISKNLLKETDVSLITFFDVVASEFGFMEEEP